MDNKDKIVGILEDAVISQMIKEYVEATGEAVVLDDNGGYLVDLVKFNKWRGV